MPITARQRRARADRSGDPFTPSPARPVAPQGSGVFPACVACTVDDRCDRIDPFGLSVAADPPAIHEAGRDHAPSRLCCDLCASVTNRTIKEHAGALSGPQAQSGGLRQRAHPGTFMWSMAEMRTSGASGDAGTGPSWPDLVKAYDDIQHHLTIVIPAGNRTDTGAGFFR